MNSKEANAHYLIKHDCFLFSFHGTQLLIEQEVNVNVRDKEGMSPSMWACRMDHIEHFELLSAVENQEITEEDGFERDLNGKTWMHWSVRRMDPLECLKVKGII